MTNKKALAEAQRRWGKTAAVDSQLGAADADERAQARERLKQLRACQEAIDAEIARRLAETPWYVELTTERKTVHKEQDRMLGRAHSYRFKVGSLGPGGMAFCVRGQGDSWEEAFAFADRK